MTPARLTALLALLPALALGLPAAATPPSDDPPPAATGSADTSDDSTEAEDDFALLYGDPDQPATVAHPDPWEATNRRIHRFNLVVDGHIARPLATTYVRVVPSFARTGVRNFFTNLGAPVSMVNQVLQGRPGHAWDTLGRFLLNTTVGLGGLLDPASAGQIPKRSEDFGQTLGVWGWRQSRYVELPFFGPRTVRDVVGMAGDAPLSPVRQVDPTLARVGVQGLSLVDTRVKLLVTDDMRAQAVDEYAMTRDAWLQRRNFQITQDLDSHHEDGFIPVDAMPIPGIGH